MLPQLFLLLAATPPPVSMFGCSVAGVGDVDGDGVPDVLIAAPVAGHCYLMSGRDGCVIRVLPKGTLVAGPGDVNGDHVPDLMISGFGWPGEEPAHAVVYSGKDGTELYRYPVGHIAAVGDFDRDGRADFIAGSEVHSGRDGSVLLRVPGADPCTIGDMNGDGIVDFASLSSGGGVRISSGRDGAALRSFGSWHGRPARCVIGGADFDVDGLPDVVVGYPDEECSGGLNYARVFSGKTGEVLHDFVSPEALFGASLAIPGDLNGDGHPDLVIGAYDTLGPSWGEVLVFSGAKWDLLDTLSDSLAERGFGIALDAVGDLDKDGVGDFIVGACKWTGPTGPAYVFVYSGKTRKLLLTLGPPDQSGK